MTEDYTNDYTVDQFFDDVDDANAGDGFEPLPDDIYQFEIAKAEMRTNKGGVKLNVGLTVINDEDGHNGRWVWFDPWVNGTSKKGRARFVTGFAGNNSAATLLKRVIQSNPDLKELLWPIPGFDPATKTVEIPQIAGTEDYDLQEWNSVCTALVGQQLYASTRTEENEKYDESTGKYVGTGTYDSKIKDLLAPDDPQIAGD